jgi:hypothetical protein
MPSSALAVPAASELLCARCGYVLSGLPTDSRCPECGTLIADSDPALRGLPVWERRPASPVAFFRTTAAVIFAPTHFFRTLVTRTNRQRSQWFAGIHLLLASLLFGSAARGHLQYTGQYNGEARSWVLLPLIAAATFVALAATNWLAAWLTHWEATYRGLRLPITAVRRAMDYHAAHYLPVAAIAAAAVWIFTALNDANRLHDRGMMVYFYVLSAEVIVAAVYLFVQYWTAMRNVMYANA